MELAPQYFAPEALVAITAGPTEIADLLRPRFDFIFFTRSVRVAKDRTGAAAENRWCTSPGSAYVHEKVADESIAECRASWPKWVLVVYLRFSSSPARTHKAIWDTGMNYHRIDSYTQRRSGCTV